MKRSFAAGALFAASMAVSAPVLAVTITVGGTPGGSTGYHSSVPGVTTVDFDGGYPAGWLISGDYAVVSGSLSGYYAAPPNSGPM